MLVLLPSPLLGPAAWEPVADALRTLGRPVTIAPVPSMPTSPADVLAGFVAALPAAGPVVLVPHSNAGLYVPALTRARSVAAAVFVDAALPDATAFTAMTPAGMYGRLAALAAPDGLLPPWTEWWGDEDLEPLFGSPEARARVEANQPRVPLAYFDASLPVPESWQRVPCAYLAFGDTYAQERELARSRGWPVRTIPGRHLHMLVAPAEVAAVIDALVRH